MFMGHVEKYNLSAYRGDPGQPLTLQIRNHPTEVALDTIDLNSCDPMNESQQQQVLRCVIECVAKRDCIALAYDGQHRETFELVKKFYHAWVESTPVAEASSKLLLVIATRADRAHTWEVERSEGEEFSRSINAEFRQMSAWEGQGTSREDLKDIAGHVLLQKARNQAATRRRDVDLATVPSIRGWRRVLSPMNWVSNLSTNRSSF